MRLISVVLGTTSDQARAQESQKLLAYGFRFFRNYPLYKAGQELNKPKVWKGVTDSVSLGLGGDLSLTIPRGSENQLAATLDLPEVIEAPLAAGEVVGHLLVTLEGEEVAREPLLALQSVEEAGFVKAIWHSIVLFFQGLFG
jgi:D-alanyl-D-alanine carboxypeptidase (penicillin-binding protein 5/6)